MLRTRSAGDLSNAEEIVVVIRPESISLGTEPSTAPNIVEGTVDSLGFLGNLVDCVVSLEDQSIRVQLVPPVSIRTGEQVTLRLPPENCIAMRG